MMIPWGGSRDALSILLQRFHHSAAYIVSELAAFCIHPSCQGSGRGVSILDCLGGFQAAQVAALCSLVARPCCEVSQPAC